MYPNPNSQDHRQFQRLQEMRRGGIEPYSHAFRRSCNLLDVRQDFSHVGHIGAEIKYELCGRIIGLRTEDNMLLVEVEEQHAQLLFVLQPESMGAVPLSEFRKYVLTGDCIGFSINKIFRVHTRELAARVTGWTMLAPCLIEPPFDEPYDEQHYRHLHLAVDRNVRRRFVTRSKIIRYLRRFLEDQFDFLETAMPAYLGSSTRQINLKRLIVGGIEAVYDIVDIAGAESFDWCGYPQSQRLDGYAAYATTTDIMRLTERLVRDLALEFFGDHVIPAQQRDMTWQEVLPGLQPENEGTSFIDLKKRWRVERFYSVVRRVTGIDFSAIGTADQALSEVRARGFDISAANVVSIGAIAVEVARRHVFPTLIQPTFVTGFPADLYPDSKRRNHHLRLSEFTELHINGMRLACCDSPLTDPEVIGAQRRETSGEMSGFDEKFIHALQCGLVPLSSLHLSIDRLVMLLTNAKDIANVIYFPLV